VQNNQGWINHPLDDQLRQLNPTKKLRAIPVQLLFNEPELNLRVNYSLFDRQSARPICVGDGETCQRRTQNGLETLACPSPEGCNLAKAGCKPYGRLNVKIDLDEQEPLTNQADKTQQRNAQDYADPLGSFIFRTTGFNSIRTLAARLHYFQAISTKRLACLPLALKLRGKSTRQSFGQPIYYVDLTLRDGWSLEHTLATAQALDQQRQAMGYDQAALDRAAKKGYQAGAFEEGDEEDNQAVVDEFYPAADTHSNQPAIQPTIQPSQAKTLAEKLQHQTQANQANPSNKAAQANQSNQPPQAKSA
jgi:hypothetical protein